MMDWPAWLSAIGTVGAFAVALWLLGVQTLDHRAQSRDQRMAQASLVSAWLRDILESKPGAREFYELVVRVRNHSAEPVYWVSIRVQVGVRGNVRAEAGHTRAG